MTVVAVTGHRPHKLGQVGFSGYDEDNPLRVWIRTQIRDVLQARKPLYGITGMALGCDQDFARTCIELEIPFIAAVPFVGQERRWPVESQTRYNELIECAHEVVIAGLGSTTIHAALQARNCWMVDHSSVLLACFNGSPGGTANTVLYAARVNRETIHINPDDFK